MPWRARIGNGLIRKIFINITKSTTVGWINGQVSVIAPPSHRRNKELDILRAKSGEHLRFALGQLIERVAREPPGVVNGWESRR